MSCLWVLDIAMDRGGLVQFNQFLVLVFTTLASHQGHFVQQPKDMHLNEPLPTTNDPYFPLRSRGIKSARSASGNESLISHLETKLGKSDSSKNPA